MNDLTEEAKQTNVTTMKGLLEALWTLETNTQHRLILLITGLQQMGAVLPEIRLKKEDLVWLDDQVLLTDNNQDLRKVSSEGEQYLTILGVKITERHDDK